MSERIQIEKLEWRMAHGANRKMDRTSEGMG